MSTGYYRFDIVKFLKEGGATIAEIQGALQLPQTGVYTADTSTSSVGQSLTLGEIVADRVLTFTDLDADREGTIMIVSNINTSGNAWLVSGNVKESSSLDDIALLEMGLHLFRWSGTYWSRFNSPSGSGGGEITEGTIDT